MADAPLLWRGSPAWWPAPSGKVFSGETDRRPGGPSHVMLVYTQLFQIENSCVALLLFCGGLRDRAVIALMSPHASVRVTHRAFVPPARRPGATEPGCYPEADPDARPLPAAVRVPEIHGPDPPGPPQLKRGREQTQGIRAFDLPDRRRPEHQLPTTTATTP